MVTSVRSLNSASFIAAHTAMCVQPESLYLRGEVTSPADIKVRRPGLRPVALFATLLPATPWSARALSSAGSPRDPVVPPASAVVLQR